MQGDGMTMTPRRPRPELRLDVWGALGATLVAWLAYLLARSNHALPDRGYAVALFTVTLVSAAVAGVVLWARAEADPALGWVAAGVGVSFVAMGLQLVALPEVTAGGGPLGTDEGGRALLYLLFHWSLLLAALAGAARAPLRWRPVAVLAGAGAALALAFSAIPTSLVLRVDQRSTAAMIDLEYLTAAAAVLAVLTWVLRSGRIAPALSGWVAVALSFNAYDALLNAIAGRTYDEEWWASLSMRVAAYGVLAIAGVSTVLTQLHRHEQYAEAELTRREQELTASLQASGQLLASAEALTGAVGELDVGRIAADTARAAVRAPRATVLVVDEISDSIRVLASAGGPEPLPPAEATHPGTPPPGDVTLPGGYALRSGYAIFLGRSEQTWATFPDLARFPELHDTAAVAALPLRLATGRVGALVVTDDRERDWPAGQRRLLTGIADQTAQALQRARLFERERGTVEILQRGMLPQRLVSAPGIQVTARYLPAARGLSVGGDWYDSIPLPDGRNVLMVGDVMGKGAPAAAVMGRARTAVRTMVTLDPRPAAILAGLDALVPELVPDGFFTLLYVLLDPADATAEIARAGHLPLLLARPDGSAELIEAGGSPAVGIPAGGRDSATVEVPDRSTLALFTDGLVEDRISGIGPGLDTLTAAFRDHGEMPLDALADHLLTVEGSAAAYDDVCLLLARS